MKKLVITILFVISVLLLSNDAGAATHLIQFGGGFGFNYVPDSIQVAAGDTVIWQGDFSMHPLSSVSVPSGAASFSRSSGTSFTYIVTMEGNYLYRCDFHSSLGMTGKIVSTVFTDVAADRNPEFPVKFQLRQNYPNPFNPSTTISFDIPYAAHVSLKIYNLIGEEVAVIADESMAAGRYSKTWNASSLTSGIFFYRLNAGNYSETRKLVLLK